MVNGTSRERIGNSIYGQYGQEFTSSDGVSFMIVALTNRHFRDLTELTGTAEGRCRTCRDTRTPTSPTRVSATGTATR